MDAFDITLVISVIVIIVCIVIIIAKSLSKKDTETPSKEETLSIINWNIYEFFNYYSKIQEGKDWILSQKPDIVALQEFHRHDELENYAKYFGHDYYIKNINRNYAIVLTSKYPIDYSKIITGGANRAIHARIKGYDIIVVHLRPGNGRLDLCKMKRNEIATQTPEQIAFDAQVIVEYANDLIKEGRKVLIMGDFNGESRLDDEFLKEKGYFETSMLTPDKNNALACVDYSMLDVFYNNGYIDLQNKLNPSNKVTYSSPALISKWRKNMTGVKKTKRRIDFVFSDPKTADSVVSADAILDDSTVGQISDHYPLLVTVKKVKN